MCRVRVSSQPPVQFATGELIHLVLFGKLTAPLHRWLLLSVDYGAMESNARTGLLLEQNATS
jgi:hypothetical protein